MFCKEHSFPLVVWFCFLITFSIKLIYFFKIIKIPIIIMTGIIVNNLSVLFCNSRFILGARDNYWYHLIIKSLIKNFKFNSGKKSPSPYWFYFEDENSPMKWFSSCLLIIWMENVLRGLLVCS
jgi:hypothetical protein